MERAGDNLSGLVHFRQRDLLGYAAGLGADDYHGICAFPASIQDEELLHMGGFHSDDLQRRHGGLLCGECERIRLKEHHLGADPAAGGIVVQHHHLQDVLPLHDSGQHY